MWTVLWGPERGFCGQHLCHQSHCSGHEALWSPIATHRPSAPPVSPEPLQCHHSRTTVWNTADNGQQPLRLDLVAMPQHSPTMPPQPGT